jgi:hypothetical protein
VVHPEFRFCEIGKGEAKVQVGSKKIDAVLIGCGLEVGLFHTLFSLFGG